MRVNVRFRVEIRDDDVRAYLVTVLQHDAHGFAVFNEHLLHAGIGPDFASGGLQRRCDRVRDRTHAAAGEAPCADAAIDVAHDVMQQDVRRARRFDAEGRADDSGAGHRRLDQVVLEIVVEVLGRTHREEADVLVEFIFAERPELLAEIQQLLNIARPERCRIGWRTHQRFADQLRVPREVRLESMHRVGVVARVAHELAMRCLLIVVREQPLVTVAEIYRAEVGDQDQAMTAEIEVPMDGLPHHAADVGAIGVFPAFVEFARDRCAADVVVLFQDDHVESGFRQIGRVRQPVVARANDDCVVIAHRRISCAALCPAAPTMSPPG